MQRLKPGDVVRVYASVYNRTEDKRDGLRPIDSEKEIDYFVVDGPSEEGYYHAWQLGSDNVYPAIKWDFTCIKEINPCS